MRFAPHTDLDVREMLAACGLSTLDELFAHLPSRVQKWAVKKTEPDPHLRYWAIEMCSRIGPEAKAAHPALIRACTDTNLGVRCNAAMALAKTQVDSTVAVPILLQMLTDKEHFVRGSAAMALGLYGEKAKAAIPALRKAADDAGFADLEFRLGLAMIEHPEKVKKFHLLGEDRYWLVRDEPYGTALSPTAMGTETRFPGFSPGGDRRDLTEGPLEIKLFFGLNWLGNYEELPTNSDLRASRLELQ